jgi:hypothetical protein
MVFTLAPDQAERQGSRRNHSGVQDGRKSLDSHRFRRHQTRVRTAAVPSVIQNERLRFDLKACGLPFLNGCVTVFSQSDWLAICRTSLKRWVPRIEKTNHD